MPKLAFWIYWRNKTVWYKKFTKNYKKSCQKWHRNTKDILQFDPFSCWQPEVHPTYLVSTQKWPKNSQKKWQNGQKIGKIAKKRVILHSKICPLEMIFFAFSPTHLLGPSERYVLDPRTLIENSVFMEIWQKQNWPF